MKSREALYTVIISAIVTTVILALVFGVLMLQQANKDAELERLEQRREMYPEFEDAQLFIGTIKTEGVKIYADASLTIVPFGGGPSRLGLQWYGNLWIINTLTVPARLSLMSEWYPSTPNLAQNLAWNYTNSLLESGEVVVVKAYLHDISPTISGTSFDIIIKAIT